MLKQLQSTFYTKNGPYYYYVSMNQREWLLNFAAPLNSLYSFSSFQLIVLVLQLYCHHSHQLIVSEVEGSSEKTTVRNLPDNKWQCKPLAMVNIRRLKHLAARAGQFICYLLWWYETIYHLRFRYIMLRHKLCFFLGFKYHIKVKLYSIWLWLVLAKVS